MGKERPTQPQETLEGLLEHLEAARQLQKDWMNYGLDCVNLYFEDVDGDWWEKWAEEEPQSFVESVTAFLESNDWVAVRVRKQLENKSLSEIATKLETYLNFPEEDQLFAVKNLLASWFFGENNRNTSNEIDEIELLNLAVELLEKLVDIRETKQDEF
ncbi:MAG: hypothetical protein KME32_03675 [Mojavia pulchra JT2-VF2]|jgi:hypothetical protein|uniref:Uncharacterized protein n=1 Tax=Mojavia pulchra JT2-VF2 TaxID=287848 RepID=A0A951PW93_9NOST|nr:hypothetical protein [Mojavia pulchra JT2-VF2]